MIRPGTNYRVAKSGDTLCVECDNYIKPYLLPLKRGRCARWCRLHIYSGPAVSKRGTCDAALKAAGGCGK
jgi:hypothetical protein